ncbi:MAG: response regulator, partial [Deltaproteobacteria bacterium]|nr:response regulator [Deltaproteobacteria bacterium]
MTPRILVVDDSLTVRMDLGEALLAASLETTLCPDVASARRALEEAPAGLIILDVLLPDEDGLEFLKELKSAQATRAIPVMLLSTEAEVQNRIRGMSAGADEYVGKPYDLGNVVARARTLLHGKSTPQSSAQPRPHALVIDDSPTFRAELTAALAAAHYEVSEAVTGEEGLALAASL